MFKAIKTIFARTLQCSKTNIEQTRSTFILRRRNEVRPSKLGAMKPKKLRRRDYYYEFVENTCSKKLPMIDLILLKNVHGIGNVGDIIQANTTKAYEYFIITGAAIYATPENVKNYAALKDENAIPIDIQNLLTELNKTPVPVFVNEVNAWTIEPWIIRVALRKIGIICNEDCIKVPEKVISGPNIDLEKKDFLITITVNKKYSVKMRCRIFHQTFIETNYYLAFNPKFYLEPIKAIFPEEQEELEKIPLPLNKQNKIVIED